MLDTAPIGFALMDRELRFRYANEHFAEFTGIPAADHVGRTATDLFGAEIGRIADEVVAKVLETGETQEAIVGAGRVAARPPALPEQPLPGPRRRRHGWSASGSARSTSPSR